MFQNRLYQRILDRSTAAYARVAACGLIGSIAGLAAFRRGSAGDRVVGEWWQSSLVGGLIGLSAGMWLFLFDVVRSSTISPRNRVWAIIGLVFFTLVVFIGVCIAILTLTGK